MNPSAHSRLSPQKAFTLIEMLVVLTVIVILSALSMPFLKGILGSTTQTAWAQHLQEEMALARQSALSRSRKVELRIYQQKSGTDFNGWQLVLYHPDGTVDQRLAKPRFMPAGVAISGDQTRSSLLYAASASLQTEDTGSGLVSGLSYASLPFAPSGGLDNLSPAPSYYYYYLTILPQNGNTTDLDDPKRIILSVDPVSGVAQFSRP